MSSCWTQTIAAYENIKSTKWAVKRQQDQQIKDAPTRFNKFLHFTVHVALHFYPKSESKLPVMHRNDWDGENHEGFIRRTQVHVWLNSFQQMSQIYMLYLFILDNGDIYSCMQQEEGEQKHNIDYKDRIKTLSCSQMNLLWNVSSAVFQLSVRFLPGIISAYWPDLSNAPVIQYLQIQNMNISIKDMTPCAADLI